MTLKKIKFICFILFFVQTICFAQENPKSVLYQTILQQDSLLFEVGFNHCDTLQIQKSLSSHFKFYHDKDGISDQRKFITDFKNGICNLKQNRQVKRTLVKERSEIFPLYNNGVLYAAIHNGIHQFNEPRELVGGEARFTNVWELENGHWKLATSLSFDHKSLEIHKVEKSIFEQDSCVEAFLKTNHIPILGIGVIHNGQLQQIKMNGTHANGIPASYQTLFNVASLTKPITTLVTLKLVSKGLWNLDEPIYKYGFTDSDIIQNQWCQKITTRLILSHQTGLPNWRGNSKNGRLSFDFEPGTQYQYSGEGYEYLRNALELKFKKSLQNLADELIFTPWKMTNTQYIWDEKMDTLEYAVGYNANRQPYPIIKRSIPNGADDVLTTISDYAKFLIHVMNGADLTSSVFHEMMRNQVATTKGKYFGLGFEIYHLKDDTLALSHGGADEGVRTLFIIFPKTKNGILIFTNADNGTMVFEPAVKYFSGVYGQEIVAIEMNQKN